MSSNAPAQPEAQPIVACTISRDVQIYDLLIEDMENVLGDRWGDLSFPDALPFLEQPEAAELQFVAIALDEQDEADLTVAIDIIAAAKRQGIGVILIAEDVSPSSLHQLLQQGADEFVPYPLPEGELQHAVNRLLQPQEAAVSDEMRHNLKPADDRDGVVIPVHGMAGGVGSTTVAVNLAWELANTDKKNPPRVCLIDLDLQFGSASTYLDLPRREAVFELLTATESMDSESFLQAMLTYHQKIYVLTAPAEVIPLDLVSPADVLRIIEMAKANFDYVVIDMPATMVEWSQTVLEAAHVYLAVLEMDMRSAQNTLRIKRALQAEDLPFEKFRFILNRAPKFTDLTGRSRVKRLAESLEISIEVQLPDGGKQVVQTCDHGAPLAEGAPKNPLRKEIAKLAKSVHQVNRSEASAR